MSVKQISIFVENRPGAMHEMTNVLAENKIDMRALSLAETEGFGIVRIIVDDAYEATTVLKEAGYINKLTPVVVVAIPDEAGGLNRVLQIFTDNNINVDYLYAIPVFKNKLRLEFSLGLGFFLSRAREYRVYESGGQAYSDKDMAKDINYFGPVKAGVSVVVPLTVFKKKGGGQ